MDVAKMVARKGSVVTREDLMRAVKQAELTQIGIVKARVAIMSIQVTGEGFEAGVVQTRHQTERQVVDRLEAKILERADGGGTARAGRAGHQNDPVPLFGLAYGSCVAHACSAARFRVAITPCGQI